MSRTGRIAAESRAGAKAFLRRRTAVFFTFVFPLLIVLIFGVLVQTDPGGGGLFAEPPSYYLAGYLAVVVLFTPLSRVGSEVARHRDGNRFEKLATTPLTRPEWLGAHALVNVGVIGVAAAIVLIAMVGLTGATIRITPTSILVVTLAVALGVVAFCGLGALLGSLADSQDGVIAAANALALPLLFLSETFVPREMLPAWLPIELSPLTFFARAVRTATTGDPVALATGAPAVVSLVVLAGWAVALLVVGGYSLPRTD